MSKKPSKNKGMSSSFKASNIQTYAGGGEMNAAAAGPGHPFKKWIERTNPTANMYASPYYTNSLVGNRIPGYRVGFNTATGAGQYEKPVGGFGGFYVGQQYDPHTPSNTFLTPNSQLDNLDFGKLNAAGNPEGPNIMFGGNIGWQGKAVKGGDGPAGIFPSAMPRLEAQAEYAPSTGIGFGAKVGSVFPIQKGNYRQGQVKGGIHNASLMLEPYTGGTFNSTKGSGFGWGLKADAEYRPRFLDKLGIPGNGYLSANFASPIGAPDQGKNLNPDGSQSDTTAGSASNPGIKWRPNFSIEGGYRVPLQKFDEIDFPKFGKGNMSALIDQARENEENNPLEQEPFVPEEGMGWGSRGEVNASPIHKKWQPDANDIFINHESTPLVPPFTYDPATGESQPTEEMNNYSKGGGIHINPANKGKFTASADAADMGVQEFASHVLANRGSYTPLQIQRANFAHNAAGWQHAQGGFNNRGFQSLPSEVQAKIKANSFADGGQLTEFNEGGTHEESPLGGIPQGMAPDGKMNLVEEGETKLNAADYVFSDQIKIDKDTATLYSLPKGDIGKTFADVSKKINRPNSRRDNDTIEQVAIQRDLESLMQAQEKQKEMQKDKDIAEFAAKYPDLAQNMPVPGQEQQMASQQPMEQPQMDPNAMQQGMAQEQMNPPAGVPQQQVDPAMMAQMQQMGQMPMSYGGSLFNCGGKMYNAGGHIYAAGGTSNVWRNIGAGAYGVGEGLLDTLTFGATDGLTDKGYEKLAAMGGRSQEDIEKDNMIRGFGNVGGAVLGAGLTGGAATSAAISEGAEGLAAGVTNIKGTGEKFDKIANGIGQGASTIAGFMGPQGATQAAGVFKGNEAVNKLMNAKQNPFINQATQFATNAFAEGGHMDYSMYQPLDHVTQFGGPLNMPTNDHSYANYLAGGGNLEGEDPINPTLGFNLNGIVANYTLEQAQKDPLVLEAFGATKDPKTGKLLEDNNLEAAMLALEEKFLENKNRVGVAQAEYDASLSKDASKDFTEKLPGETDAQYQSRVIPMQVMNAKQNAKPGVGEIKQTPLQGAMMALPAAYNIGRGIFGKPNLLNYNDYAQKANIEPYTMNVDPQLAETRKSYAGAAQAIRNAAPGGGAYLTNMENLAASKQRAINETLTKKEMFDKEAKYKTDLANREINNNNLDLKMKLQTYNDAAKAAKANSLKEGLSQLADIAKNEEGISLQEALLKLTSPDYAEKFNYSSLFEQLQAAAKAKKGTKAGK